MFFFLRNFEILGRKLVSEGVKAICTLKFDELRLNQKGVLPIFFFYFESSHGTFKFEGVAHSRNQNPDFLI